MPERNQVISVHFARERASKGGYLDEETARWSGLIKLGGIPCIANLAAYGRSDVRLPTETVNLMLKPIATFSESGLSTIALTVFEHQNKSVHIHTGFNPQSKGFDPESFHPLHWYFTHPKMEPGPIYLSDIDMKKHSSLKDMQELLLIWRISQAIIHA